MRLARPSLSVYCSLVAYPLSWGRFVPDPFCIRSLTPADGTLLTSSKPNKGLQRGRSLIHVTEEEPAFPGMKEGPAAPYQKVNTRSVLKILRFIIVDSKNVIELGGCVKI